MSSEGSVSSRISQFGLYRTIDARTEEFLKLSKKRQLRQGCVCAAITTALTVTVVVTVLLIYEYNVIAKARRSNYKNNWLGLMNNSADDSNLLEILNKENINFDKTTLKLLPILLKALQNSYTDKSIEETTSRYAPYEKDITTETTVTKNIFADTRNWMKTTPSRLYAIEYKTSPIVYFKNPTRNIEYFTKIRKIRDYQRILNYVDKMISEKNFLGTTQPMRSDYGHTEKPYKLTTPFLKHKPKHLAINTQKKQKRPRNTTAEGKQRNCKCFYKLSGAMYKLLGSIQQLLSFFSGPNSKELLRCKNNTLIETKPLKPLVGTSASKTEYETITEKYNNFETKMTKAPSYKTFLNRHKYIIDSPAKGINIRRDHTVNAIMNLIKPNFNKYNEDYIKFESNEAFSTTNGYQKSSDFNNIFKESTQIDNTYTKSSTDTVITVADYILQKGSYDVSSEMRSPLSTFPGPDFSDDEDDYSEITETNKIISNYVRKNDTHNQDLKSNLLTENHINSSMNKYSFKGARASQKIYNILGSMRKIGKLVSNDIEESPISNYKYRFAPILNQTTIPTTDSTNSRFDIKENITSTIKPTRQTLAPTTENNTTKEIESANYETYRTNHSLSEYDLDKMLDENVSKESSLKHIEEAIMILNNETSTKEVENYTKNLDDNYQWEVVKSEENSTVTKSILPRGRSTYLEMQRNDWKHEEIHDFDNDMDIFD